MFNPLSADLDHIVDSTSDSWQQMRGKRLFITGGTGFFGCWLLESFLRANERLNLQTSATVLTRNLPAFEEKALYLARNPALVFQTGDVSSFDFPTGNFSYIIHAATDVYDKTSPLQTIDTIVSGTRRVLEFAAQSEAEKVLFVSSGAVYGRQPPTLSHVGEDYGGAPDCININSAYGEGKRMAELLCAAYVEKYDFEVKIARCFAFVGGYLSLGGQLAIGNFIKDALDGKSINISGDGTTVRSYLYAADLAVWLWTILFRGKSCFPYNVGSQAEISIADLAETIVKVSNNEATVKITGKSSGGSSLPERYVPLTHRAFVDLGLQTVVDLESAIKKTLDFYIQLKSGSR